MRHGLAGHPRVGGDGGHHVQGEPQVGVPVHIDRVVPEVGRGLIGFGCEEGRREQTLMSVVIVTMVVMVVTASRDTMAAPLRQALT